MLSPHNLLICSHRDDGSSKLLAHAVEGVLQAGLPDGLQPLLAAANAGTLVLVVAEARVRLTCLHQAHLCQGACVTSDVKSNKDQASYL